MTRAFVASTILWLLAYSPSEARVPRDLQPTPVFPASTTPLDDARRLNPHLVMSATETTMLASYRFNTGLVCDAHGWVAIDVTAQTAAFWHVDDFVGANTNAGDSYAPLAGAKSLWCGARTVSSGALCGYATLPGYGNDWDQLWQTKACITVTGELDVSFLMSVDTEPDWYDTIALEYSSECSPHYLDWTALDQWSGVQTLTHSRSYAVGFGPVKVRLRFRSDAYYSDQDGLYDSHAGAVVIDDLSVENLPLEDFEGELVGATSSQDWESAFGQTFGLYLALFPGATLVQEDQCARTLGCAWAAIAGSTESYACGGFPSQATVPDGISGGLYIDNEIWSPPIPISGSGNVLNLELSVYLDIGQGDLVFYTWDVRTITADGCATPWRSRNYLYSGQYKEWVMSTYPVADLLDLAQGVALQVKLAVVDMCKYWCMGLGICHSHAPLFNGVRVYRVDIVGPVWSARDVDMFQDTFPEDGSDTGIGRADAALDIAGWYNAPLIPADSAIITCRDPITAVPVSNPSGLGDDVALGGKQCYLWVRVVDSGVPSNTKVGAVLSGGPLYPFKDTQLLDGETWTRIQCWLRDVTRNTFVVDLNDNLFEAGDVIQFFFGATSTTGLTSYCSGTTLNLVQSDITLAAETAAEFSVLPTNGGGSTDVLYIDGVDGRGGQVYWDSAFEQLGVSPDRFDIRAGHIAGNNLPAAHVTNTTEQITANYRVILWDRGDLFHGLSDGSVPYKSDDFALLNEFLGGLNATGGIYLCGDNLPTAVQNAGGQSTITFRSTYITYTIIGGRHGQLFGASPIGTGTNGSAFQNDTWVISGGCPRPNEFDVMLPTGSSVAAASYGPLANNAAVVAKATGQARVLLSGFSFVYVRDDDEDGVMDRAKHLHDILTFLGGSPSPPTDAGPVSINSLGQNYPNPFNPQTTIAFSLKQRGHVRIDVYDVTGALVRTLLNETRTPGAYSDVRWDGHDRNGRRVASGVYFYKLVTDGFEQTRKMVLLK